MYQREIGHSTVEHNKKKSIAQYKHITAHSTKHIPNIATFTPSATTATTQTRIAAKPAVPLGSLGSCRLGEDCAETIERATIIPLHAAAKPPDSTLSTTALYTRRTHALFSQNTVK